MTLKDPVDLSPYLPRLALDWLASSDQATHRSIDGTIAFVDISGFTKLSEKLAKLGKVGAEELTGAIGSCFTELLTVAYADGGGLIKFGGDALLLLFTGEAHEVRACRAAAVMRTTLRTAGNIQTPGGRVRLRMSVGVHSGRFDFFLVGSDHRELIVTGPAATETVLMEQAAEAGEIVVTARTAAALPSRHVGEPKGAGLLLRGTPAGHVGSPYVPPDRAAWTRAARGLSPAIREHLLGGATEPEHRLATVTFIRFEGADDVIGSAGPSEMALRLGALVDIVGAACAEHGVAFLSSDIDRDGGKLILAAGAPRATGSDEEASLIAARKIVESDPPLPLKIGINRGHVFAGDIGPAYRRTYTVMGDTVNLAARLMASSEPGEIRAPASVTERSRTEFSTRALPPFTVKGKAKPVHAFVVGPAIAGQTAGPDTAGPLVGRDMELAELYAMLDEARAGRGRTVELVGGPGMGVSRVAEEVRLTASGTQTYWTSGGPYAASSPYLPFRTLLRDALGVDKDLPPAGTAAMVQSRVDAVAPDLVPWLPLIGVVMDLPFAPTPETERLGEEFRRSRLEQVCVDLLSVVVRRPALMVFEDVHYFDNASRALLAALATSVEERPWLIVATRREDASERAADMPPNTRTIVLGPLDAAATRQLAEAATEDAPLSEHELALIVERSGGNPLVLRELLNMATTAGTADDLPESVEALMTARIDRLPPRDRALLRSASVLGTSFDEDLLGAVLAEEVPARDDPVWKRIARYIAPDRSGYRFANPLIRDAAYEGLTFRARKTLHARVGETLMRSGGPLEEHAELLALHFSQAGRAFETWRFARVAGERARQKYANVEAAGFLARALEAARRLPGIPSEDVLAVHESLADVWAAAGEFRKAERAYVAARAVAKGHKVTDARLLFKEAQIADRLGRFSVALRRLSRGRALLDGDASDEAAAQRAQLSMWYAAVRQEQGRHRDAIAWCRRAIDEAEASGDRKALAYANQILDWALDSLGESDRSHLRIALDIYEEIGDLKGEAVVLNNLGTAEYWAGNWDAAVELYERSRLAHEHIGDPVGAGLGIFNIGEILSDQGRLDEAEPMLRRALRLSKAAGERSGVAYALSQLARTAARAGRTEEAMAGYEAAREEFAGIGDAAGVTETEARVAECHVLRGAAHEALAIADDLLERTRAKEGLATLLPLLHRVRGYALLQTGDLDAAREALGFSLESAAGTDYEYAHTLRALAVLADAAGVPDPARLAEAARIFDRLGVVTTFDPPAHAGGSNGSDADRASDPRAGRPR